MKLQFGIGEMRRMVARGTTINREVSLTEVEEACNVLGLELKNISRPENVVGEGSDFQWYITVELDDDEFSGKLHYIGDLSKETKEKAMGR